MIEFAQTATLVAATLTTGAMAGLFYAFDCAVMRGLRRVDDHTFVETMRAINVAILNGWFGLAFGGALLFTAVTAALHLGGGSSSALPWILAALVLYVFVLGVTGRVNVPLNQRLQTASIASEEDLRAARAGFEVRWNRWNQVRTIANTAAFAALALALLAH